MKAIIVLLLIGLCNLGNAQDRRTTSLSSEYLGQKPPGLVPEIFAPELISGKGRLHCFPTFSPELKEMIWFTLPPKMVCMKDSSGVWTSPQVVSFAQAGNNQAPFWSSDNKVYFASNRPGGNGSLDIWSTVKNKDGFSEPLNLGSEINTKYSESQPTCSTAGTLFYAGAVAGKLYNRGIYSSIYKNDKYQTPVLLAEPINIMDPQILDYTPFIAPDESYLLFSSNRQNPEQELCHIYISHKNETGDWSEPIDLSAKMNFTQSSKFPYISPDGKYLFFSSGKNFYWVSTDVFK